MWMYYAYLMRCVISCCVVYDILCKTYFIFKQMTAYEKRISDWSSDVCSSDLSRGRRITADELAKLADLYDTKLSWLLGDAPERAATDDPKLQLAARELSKLKPDDLDRLLKLIAAMKYDDDAKGEIGRAS